MNRKLKAVVSGSFKFKPEIDETIEELQDHGVEVLAPEKGWLFLPRQRLILPRERDAFRPLPSERDMPIVMVEESFLRALKLSDFVYIVNPGGYFGNSVALEMGTAMARNVAMYAREALDFDSADWEDNFITRQMVESSVSVMTVKEACADALPVNGD